MPGDTCERLSAAFEDVLRIEDFVIIEEVIPDFLIDDSYGLLTDYS
jgi:hypothetical protein